MRYKYVPLLSNGVKPLNELEAVIVLLPVLFVSVLFRYVIVVGMVIEPSVNCANPILCDIENEVLLNLATCKSCCLKMVSEFCVAAGLQPATTFAKECPESFVHRD